MKLHLGCGDKSLSGFINIDMMASSAADLVYNLNQLWPFPDCSVEEIWSDNFLEHVDDLSHTMREARRVLKLGGHFSGRVPYAGSHWAFQDPTHKHFFTEQTFSYFCGRASYVEEGFEIISVKLVSTATTPLGRIRDLIPFKGVLKNFLWNMYDDVEFRLRRAS